MMRTEMKPKELKQIRVKNKRELEKLAQEKKKELAKETANVNLGRTKNIRSARNLRLEIAQLMTILREKEIEA